MIDASVAVDRVFPDDVHHDASRRWLERHVAGDEVIIAPGLLLVEVAGAVARRPREQRLAIRAVAILSRLPDLRLVVLDRVLARSAANLVARLGLRGADAVYVATAMEARMPLVTWDAEQRERAARAVAVISPDAE